MSQITNEQRYTIEVLLESNVSKPEIARILGKDKSVIYRELKRNFDEATGIYKSSLAQRRCEKRHSDKVKIIYFTQFVKDYVDYWLVNEQYSPEQIVETAKGEGKYFVSVERIYQYIWQDKKEGGELYKHLRNSEKRYRKRGAAKDKRGQIVGRIGIENRPPVVDLKQRFGDFEIDLIIGSGHKQAILTANDRATGLLRMIKVESKESSVIEKAVLKILGEFNSQLHTITSDNGKEFANHINISTVLNIDYYFARPYHSWERGANENLNGLIRQYFPKGTSFESITTEDIKIAQNKLNNRPRKRFGFKSPNEVYLQTLNNNGQVAFMS